MTDRKVFDLFYGAREGDYGMCRRAYETGADINFAFDGRRATKGGAGRWYVCSRVHVVLTPPTCYFKLNKYEKTARALAFSVHSPCKQKGPLHCC